MYILARTSALIFTACHACRGMLGLCDSIAIVNARHLSREPVSGMNWLMLNTISDGTGQTGLGYPTGYPDFIQWTWTEARPTGYPTGLDIHWISG
jgi:hypothetical protein